MSAFLKCWEVKLRYHINYTTSEAIIIEYVSYPCVGSFRSCLCIFFCQGSHKEAYYSTKGRRTYVLCADSLIRVIGLDVALNEL